MEFTARSNDCRVCYRTVTARQHALECDRCQQWTHRLCGTGISYTQYRGIMENMRYGATFPCATCTTEAASNDEALILQSTRIDAATQ